MSMEDPKEVDDTLYIVDVQQRQGINYFLIESIISRAGNTLKLRFQDGSVGEIDMLEAFGFAMESPKVIDDRIEWVAVGEGWRVPTYTNSRRLWQHTKFI